MARTPADEALLGVARLAMDASVRAAGDLGGLSPVQLRALTAMQQKGTLNLVGLAADMGVTVSTASRLVDRLVVLDWVHRGPSTRDRREISLSLTAAGTTLLRRFDDRRLIVLSHHLDRLPADRRDAVVDALTELVGLARA